MQHREESRKFELQQQLDQLHTDKQNLLNALELRNNQQKKS